MMQNDAVQCLNCEANRKREIICRKDAIIVDLSHFERKYIGEGAIKHNLLCIHYVYGEQRTVSKIF